MEGDNLDKLLNAFSRFNWIGEVRVLGWQDGGEVATFDQAIVLKQQWEERGRRAQIMHSEHGYRVMLEPR